MSTITEVKKITINSNQQYQRLKEFEKAGVNVFGRDFEAGFVYGLELLEDKKDVFAKLKALLEYLGSRITSDKNPGEQQRRAI